MDASSIVVGRVVALPAILDGGTARRTITYTVYNNESQAETGVLLTTTLASGVTYAIASQPPERAGSNLAWSLGTIAPFGRASVTLTVDMPATASGAIDAGAHAFATFVGGTVSDAAPAATIPPTPPNLGLLASTPDANITDPFVQEKAAELDYDPQKIFDFLHTQIGYNSYAGSVRGARGTLWSSAGNALDVASLGVALMRASGIPAQYASGTLVASQAQSLILSMFPAPLQTVGLIPAGTPLADPANDPELLAETTIHSWFQYDAGSGMTDADPLMPGATVGRAFTSPTGTFAEVPDALREKTQIQVVAEALGEMEELFGDAPARQVVLDQTFNDVDLVGHPLTLSYAVSSSTRGLGIYQAVHTYSPRLAVGDAAKPDSSTDPVIPGTDFQEIYSSLQLVGVALTGLFLDVTFSGPQGQPQTHEHTVFDRIGLAARQRPFSLDLPFDLGTPPALTVLDATVVNVLPGLQGLQAIGPQYDQFLQDARRLEALDGTVDANLPYTLPAVRSFDASLARVLDQRMLTLSDSLTSELAAQSRVAAYFDRPRVVVSSQAIDPDGVPILGMDLMVDAIRAVAGPGQAPDSAYAFNMNRGFAEDAVETRRVQALADPGVTALSTGNILLAAREQGIAIAVLQGDGDLNRLDSFNLGADANARIAGALLSGQVVMVPTARVTIDGKAVAAWFQIDPATGFMTGVGPDGSHFGMLERVATVGLIALLILATPNPISNRLHHMLPAIHVRDFETRAAEYLKANKDQQEAAGEDIVNHKESDVLQLKRIALRESNLVTDDAMRADLFGRLEAAFRSLNANVTFRTLAIKSVGEKAYNQLVDADPSVPSELWSLQIPRPDPVHQAVGSVAAAASVPAGPTTAATSVGAVTASGKIVADWSSAADGTYQVASLSAVGARVTSVGGQAVGPGLVGLNTTALTWATVSGRREEHVDGQGRLSFYGPAGPSLGVGGEWDGYSAALAGTLSITLTTDGLTLDGQALPAGTYTITAGSATLTGGGLSMSPSFAGSAAMSLTGGTVALGSRGGSINVGGQPVDLGSGAVLADYRGSLSVTGTGSGTVSVRLNGTAGNVLTVGTQPASLSTDQNTPISFQADVRTSLADTYDLLARAPEGWTVTVDAAGKVTVRPAPGTQGGTFPVLLIAQSRTNRDLLAQTTVQVSVTPTQAGTRLAVVPDPTLTVPFRGGEIPTAFQVRIHNAGPVAVTEDIAFSNVPPGFTVLSSVTSVTIPAGQTGIVGVYLVPTGTTPPAAGSTASFTVTATDHADPSKVQSANGSLTVPAIDGLTLAPSYPEVSTAPGTSISVSLVVTNVGNVAETVNLAAGTLPAGVTADTPAPLTLAPGASATVVVHVSAAASLANDSTFRLPFTAAYVPSGVLTATSQVLLRLRPSLPLVLQQAADTAGATGAEQLRGTLSNLADSLAILQAHPENAPALSRTRLQLAQLDALLQTDPALRPLIPALRNLRDSAQGGDVSSVLEQASSLFPGLSSVLSQEALSQFTVAIGPGTVDARPGEAFGVSLRITSLSLAPMNVTLNPGPLPAGVTADLAPGTTISVDPGQTVTVPVTLAQSFTRSGRFTYFVEANAGPTYHPVSMLVRVGLAVVDVLSVTASPAAVDPGTPIGLGATAFNTANVGRDLLAHVDFLDASASVVFSPPDLPVHVDSGAGNFTIDLGSIPTDGLAAGLYSAVVSLRAADGSPLPGRIASTSVVVGQPVSASISVDQPVLAPGTSQVTTTIRLGGFSTNSHQFVEVNVPGSSDPFLAGMPDGAQGPGGDVAPQQSPPIADGLTLVPGTALNFDVTGSVNYVPGPSGFGPDGDPGFPYGTSGPANGISNVGARIDALLGIFLGPDQPSLDPVPDRLDFNAGGNVSGGTNFTTLAPGLRQLFFIGDGRTDGGQVQQFVVPAGATRLALATMDGYGWYNNYGSFDVRVRQADHVSFSSTIIHTLPADGFTTDPSQASPAPASASGSTVNWVASGLDGAVANLFTISGTVVDLAPGEVRTISLGTSVAVTANVLGQTLSYTIPLPPVMVSARHIIGLSPGSRSADLGGEATYTVSLFNPRTTPETYTLHVSGLDGLTADLATTITVAGGATATTVLTIGVPITAAAVARNFSVVATGSSGAVDSAEGQLDVSTTVVVPREAVALTLSPVQPVFGPGTSATYRVTVFNTGDVTTTYALAGLFPAGIQGAFGATTITVAPGASNARTVLLALSSQGSVAPGAIPFDVSATATDDPDVSATASGAATLATAGVGVSLTPGSAGAGSSFQLIVTNTGTTQETYDLKLAGPAALASTLATSSVTLAPGASQAVPIATTGASFAVPGSLGLVGMATARSQSGVRGRASASLVVAGTSGQGAAFLPPSQALAKPGLASFLLRVDNTGNVEDSYSVSIVGTSGPVSATLIGPDGQSTQAVSTLILPALGSGGLPLRAVLNATGQGSVTVRLTSLSTGRVTDVTAVVTAEALPGPVPTDGPKVTQVLRYGVHMNPTTLVLTFDQPLDPARATDVSAYRLVGPGGRIIPIASAVYDPASLTVTLHPASRINLHRAYRLTVDGASATGLTGSAGQLLDGNADGTPGGNYETSVTWRNLVPPANWRRPFAKLRRVSKSVLAGPRAPLTPRLPRRPIASVAPRTPRGAPESGPIGL